MFTDLTLLCLPESSTIGEVLALMDQSKLGVALVVDSEGRLKGVITDGDMRRAILTHISLESSTEVILQSKEKSPFAHPITSAISDDRGTYLELLQKHNILHLPILDDTKKVVGLVMLDDFLNGPRHPIHAVIMAGGKGTRLLPLTEGIPKPMLHVGSRPLLEIIIEQLRNIGVQRVNLTTHHNGDKIFKHFGDGKKFGVELNYVTENQPLGTAGGLSLLEPPDHTMLVINGDILTQVDFKSMLDFHYLHKADITIGVKRYDVQVPFGVVECEGPLVREVSEKPALNLFVNAGIYLLEPMVYRYLQDGEVCHMTDLIQNLLRDEGKVISFPIHEYWLDIGRPEDYEQAQGYIRTEEL